MTKALVYLCSFLDIARTWQCGINDPDQGSNWGFSDHKFSCCYTNTLFPGTVPAYYIKEYLL